MFWQLAGVVSGGHIRTRVRGNKRAVYLTFDDGPHPVHTPRILSLLQRLGCQATFFLIGDRAQEYPETVRAILSGGHKIGNHSFSHPRWRAIKESERLAEIARTDAILCEFDGAQRHDFRPPRGEISARLAVDCLLRRGHVSHWSRDSFDYRLPAAEVIAGLKSPQVRPGDIILFHDDQPVAADALEVLLPEWASQGFSFLRLPD